MHASLKLLFGILAVAGAAVALVPTSAQPPERRTTVPDGLQPDRVGLDRVQQDLKRAAEDLAKTKQDIDRLTKEYEHKAAALKTAMDQVRKAEEQLANGKGGKWVFSIVDDGARFGGSLDKRLADIEKKLDTVMHGVEELQKQLAKRNPPVPNPPGGPLIPGGPGQPGGPGAGAPPNPGGPTGPGLPQSK